MCVPTGTTDLIPGSQQGVVVGVSLSLVIFFLLTHLPEGNGAVSPSIHLFTKKTHFFEDP